MILKNNKKINEIHFKGKKIASIIKNGKLLFGKKLKFLTPYWMAIDQSNVKEPVKFTKSPLIDSFFDWFVESLRPCLGIMQENGVLACAELWHQRSNTIPYGIDRADAYALTEESAKDEIGNQKIDRFVYFPKVYYKGVEVEKDKWLIYFDKKPFFGSVSNLGKFLGWTCANNQNTTDRVYSTDHVSEYSFDEFLTRARNRGKGYDLISWDIHCLLNVIYMINQGTKKMTDSNNLFGLDSWVFDRDEWWGGCYAQDKIVKVTHDDGTYEEFDCTFYPNTVLSANVNKFYFGKYLMLIPSDIGDLKNWGDQVGQGSPWESGIGLYKNGGPYYAAFPENSCRSPFSGAFDKDSAAAKIMYEGPAEWMETEEQLEYFKNLPIIN